MPQTTPTWPAQILAPWAHLASSVFWLTPRGTSFSLDTQFSALDPSLGKRNLELRLLNWRGVRILGLALIMINVHTLPPVFYHLFFSHSYFHWLFFLSYSTAFYPSNHSLMDFLFYSLSVKHISYSPLLLWTALIHFVFLSPLSLSANTGFAAKFPPQLSFPKSGAEREGLKQTPQFLSKSPLGWDITQNVFFPPFPQKLCCPTPHLHWIQFSITSSINTYPKSEQQHFCWVGIECQFLTVMPKTFRGSLSFF